MQSVLACRSQLVSSAQRDRSPLEQIWFDTCSKGVTTCLGPEPVWAFLQDQGTCTVMSTWQYLMLVRNFQYLDKFTVETLIGGRVYFVIPQQLELVLLRLSTDNIIHAEVSVKPQYFVQQVFSVRTFFQELCTRIQAGYGDTKLLELCTRMQASCLVTAKI